MKKGLFLFLLFLFSSCVSPESRFVKLRDIDFSRHSDYSVIDFRDGNYYTIHYQGNKYWIRYPLRSNQIIELWRYYTERELDSLSLKEGRDKIVEVLETDTPLASLFQDICDTYKQTWRIDYKRLYVRWVFVNAENDVFMTIIWKPTNEVYRILLSDNGLDALKSFEFSDLSPMLEYKEIEPGLYYRCEGKE